MGRSTCRYASKGSERVWQRLANVEDMQDVSGDVRLAWGGRGRGRGRWGLAVVAAVQGTGCYAHEAALGRVDGGWDARGQGSWQVGGVQDA